MFNIAFYPGHHSNPYFDLYNRALAGYGVTVRGGPVNDGFLRAEAGNLDAFHFQWLAERLWQISGKSWYSQIRGQLSLLRFLRLNRKLGLKLLWTIHDLEHHEGSSWIDHLGFRLIAQYTDLCICHSEWCRQQILRRYRLPPEAVLGHPPWELRRRLSSARPREATRAEWGLDPNRRTLLCFGYVRPYKGFDLAVQVMRRLGPEYQLLIAGTTPLPNYPDTLREAARGLENVHCHFRGLSDQEIADTLELADCVVFPYRKITGSGALVLALGFGRGVVTSDLPYFRETLAPEPEAGEYFPCGDVGALAAAIDRFFAMPTKHRSAVARRLADRYAWDKAVVPVVDWMHKHFARKRIPQG